MIVLILNGPARAGKGTVIKYIKEIFNVYPCVYSSIDYVKEVAEEKFGWDGKKDTEGRNLLAGIKQVMIAYNDMPTMKIISQLKEAIFFKMEVLVADIREPDEIEKIVNHCIKMDILCYTCRVHNKKAEEDAEVNGLSLTGDRLFGEYDYDINIKNDGTLKGLKKKVNTAFYNVFRGGK